MTESYSDDAIQPREQEDEGDIPILDIDYRDEIIESAFDITSYGADFLADGLIARLASGDILIPTFDPAVPSDSQVTGFQRGFVWTKPQCDKFIESILLGLPIPEIYLVREPNNVFLVMDGQQRLRTMANFKKGTLRGREFKLEKVQSTFKGATYESLDPEDRRRFDNTIIHATILHPKEEGGDEQAVYLAFERINSGGTALNAHEIRVALYRGDLIELVRELSAQDAWRQLYGPPSKRFKDQELALRFLALNESGDDYQRPMKRFLNDFVRARRNMTEGQRQRLAEVFNRVVTVILEHIGPGAFKPRRVLNAAVMDSVMVGIARNLDKGTLVEPPDLAQRHGDLLADAEYKAATEQSTADEESVHTRLRLAELAFRA